LDNRLRIAAPHFHSEAAAFDFVEARLWPDGPVRAKLGIDDVARAEIALKGPRASGSPIERLVENGARKRPPLGRLRWHRARESDEDPRQLKLPLLQERNS
jgi:hypothetical protein